MPVAPVDTAEVVKAKEQFFTSYQLEQEKQEKIQLEMKAEEKKMGGMYKTLIFFKHVKPSISIQIINRDRFVGHLSLPIGYQSCVIKCCGLKF